MPERRPERQGSGRVCAAQPNTMSRPFNRFNSRDKGLYECPSLFKKSHRTFESFEGIIKELSKTPQSRFCWAALYDRIRIA
jgi:hypothetical protein